MVYSRRSMIAFLGFWGLVSGAAIQGRGTNVNPAMGLDFADPSILQVGSTWYAFATNGRGSNVQVASSDDFNNWQYRGGYDALQNLPGWVNRGDPQVWAPNVVQISSDRFVLYFAAKSASNSRIHCIGAASSSSPTGPFDPVGSPLACNDGEGGAIDPSGYYDTATNRRFVVYKIDGNNFGNGGNCNNGISPIRSTPIMLLEVSGDGIYAIGGPTSILDRSDADGPLVEAPSITKIAGKYFLFFSSNCYDGPLYDSSFAVSDSVYGPYEKRGPLLITGDLGFFAPGGLEVASDGVHVAFHAGRVNERYMYTGWLSSDGGGSQITLCTNAGCKNAS